MKMDHMINRKPLNLMEYWTLGREQRYKYKNPLIKLFILMFGSLGINSRIRSGHVLSLIKEMNLIEPKSILDAGCGQSEVLFWISKRFPNLKLTGIDFDEERINDNKVISEKLHIKNIQFEIGDLKELGCEKKYDLIISADVLEHIGDDNLVVQRFYKCLTVSGLLILHLPKRNSLAWRFFPVFREYKTHDHVRPEYSSEEILHLLSAQGFKINQIYTTYGKCGEIAFELNYLCWKYPLLRMFLAVLTFPLSFFFGFLDLTNRNIEGNAFLIIASAKE